MELQRHRGPIRFALIYLAVTMGAVAVWILVAPKNFYDEFPGGGWHLVSVLPPYNEHLERDFGAAGLGLTVLVILAAVWMERRVVQAAAIVVFVATLPHAIYHSTQTAPMTLPENLFNLGGLYLQALLPLLVLYLASEGAQRLPAGAPRA